MDEGRYESWRRDYRPCTTATWWLGMADALRGMVAMNAVLHVDYDAARGVWSGAFKGQHGGAPHSQCCDW